MPRITQSEGYLRHPKAQQTDAAAGRVHGGGAAMPAPGSAPAGVAGVYLHAQGLGRPLRAGYRNEPLYGPAPKTSTVLQSQRIGGSRSAQGMGSQPGGYLPAQEGYKPGAVLTNQPVLDNTFMRRLPRTINIGDNGGRSVGAYWNVTAPRDFFIATRWQPSTRSATNWQQDFFPGFNRQLLRYQPVQRYTTQNSVILARPVSVNDYFLGYRMAQSSAAGYGASGVTRGLGA